MQWENEEPAQEGDRHTFLTTKTRSLDPLGTVVTRNGLLEWKPDICHPTQGQRQHAHTSGQLVPARATLMHSAPVSPGRVAQNTSPRGEVKCPLPRSTQGPWTLRDKGRRGLWGGSLCRAPPPTHTANGRGVRRGVGVLKQRVP